MPQQSVVCIVPFLPLRESLQVGSWMLTPISEARAVVWGADLAFAQRLTVAYCIRDATSAGRRV